MITGRHNGQVRKVVVDSVSFSHSHQYYQALKKKTTQTMEIKISIQHKMQHCAIDLSHRCIAEHETKGIKAQKQSWS